MAVRTAHALAAILALALAVRAFHVARVDSGYVSAVGFGVPAAEDLPGRLEAYEAAAAADPGETAYAFRAGRLRLSRAFDAEGEERSAQAAAALAHLERAVELQPLDPRVRIALSGALHLCGDDAGAVRETHTSVLLGPRHPSALSRACRIFADRWRRTRDPADLREALDVAAKLLRIGQHVSTAPLAKRLQERGALAAPDVLEAAADAPELLEAAATLVEDRDAACAAELQAAAARALGGGTR